ncbi:Smr/MutS family protein [Candidatus Uhrbacteria bacterium]|nr:Smr/MutS family protein [Candidatus Uhrbacteria bacterium]
MPKPWKTRERSVLEQTTEETSEQKTERELTLGMMDSSLPLIDLHGYTRDSVAHELDAFFGVQKEGTCVRVMYGVGKGILKEEVNAYLKNELTKPNSPVTAYRTDLVTASVVVLMK